MSDFLAIQLILQITVNSLKYPLKNVIVVFVCALSKKECRIYACMFAVLVYYTKLCVYQCHYQYDHHYC